MKRSMHIPDPAQEPDVPSVDAPADAAPDQETETVIPQALPDDPVISDGSSARDGVEMSKWRIHKLKSDELVDMVEPEGRDWASRRARKAHAASRKARSGHRRTVRGRLRVFVAVLFVAVAIGLVAAGITYSLELWGGKTLPNVVGVAQAKAEETLEGKGFLIQTSTELADLPEDHVTAMKPDPGERLAKGTTVFLTIAQNRVIPEVEGLSKDEAKQALEEQGCTNIRYEWRDTLEDENVVLEVHPSAGSTFLSSDEVVLVISQAPTVPDVVGMTESEAHETLSNRDFPVEFTYEECEEDQRRKVLSTDPGPGEAMGEEGMTVHVGDPLRDVLHLADYFDARGSRIEGFLTGQGFEREVGSVSDDGHESVRYKNGEGDIVAFVSDPWSHKVDDVKLGNNDVMGSVKTIDGVRFSTTYVGPKVRKSTTTVGNETKTTTVEVDNEPATYSSSSILGLENPSVGKSTANEVMERCGFEGMLGSCTQRDITLPKGTSNTGKDFYCCYGESGAYVWTVLLQATTTTTNNKAIKVTATCAPKSAYNVIDLSAFGNKICDFVAYWDVYAD